MFSSARSITTRARLGVVVSAIVFTLALWYRPPFAQPVPPLASPPLASLDTNPPPPAGQTLFVPAGGDLQGAIDRARPGDVVTLQPGAAFVGNFLLPAKTGSDWIVIRSAAPDGKLPPPGSRVAPSDSAALAKIVTPNALPAIATDAAAHHFHFIGVEITTTHPALETLVRLEYRRGQDSLSQAPTDIIFDRCYIHGTAAGSVRRGIALNSARTAVIDSYLSDFHRMDGDSQAIMGWNGPGPFKIVNSYLEAAGENLLFGGLDPAVPNLVPSDIEVRGNYFNKPLTWRAGHPNYAGRSWSVGGLLALKNAQRAVIEDNVFEHAWADAENGFAVLFTVQNPNGVAPWSAVQDITFRRNIVRHSGAGLNIRGQDGNFPSQQTRRILIQDNLFKDISGVLFQIVGGTANVVIDHNTGLQSGSGIVADAAANTGFVYQNNITLHNEPATDGLAREGAVNARFPGQVFSRNVLTGANPAGYPAENFFPAAAGDIGFANPAAGDYQLTPGSPYYNGGTDGADVGVNFAAVLASTASVIDGRRNLYEAKSWRTTG